MKNNKYIKDLTIIVLSIIVAINLANTGAFKHLLTSTQEMKFVGSFIAGVFFVSLFTAAPAIVVLTEIAQSNSILWVAFFGGIGALVGDLIIFRFVKNELSQNVSPIFKNSKSKLLLLAARLQLVRWFAPFLIKHPKSKLLLSMFRLWLARWLLPVLGALIIASPFPDELGLAMMGFSKIKISVFIPLSFFLNFSGILIIGFITKTIS